MEGFLHVSLKKNIDYLDKGIIKNVINQFKDFKHTFKFIENDSMIGTYYTNEHDSYPYFDTPNKLFAPAGQFTIPHTSVEEGFMNNDESSSRQFVSQLSGAFILSSVLLNQKTINVMTHTLRAESAFLYEDSEKIIVGTDPLIISVLSTESLIPIFDEQNFVPFFEQGYFADESSPYKNVICLPPNTHVKINDSGVHYNDVDDTFKNAFKSHADDSYYASITQDFLNSFNIVEQNDEVINSGLTGGKDSRIVLIALLEKGFNVHTHTTGFQDHPDVIVAKMLAESLNIPHKVNERKLNKANQIVVSLEERLYNTMKASSGMITAYDSVNTKKEFKNQKNFNGIAASVLTGGFNKFSHRIENGIAESLKRPLYKFKEYYLDENTRYSQFLEDFAEQSDDLGELLHLFFLKYRTGRWTSDSRKPKSYSSNSYSVFLDNQLSKNVMKLNLEQLREERIHYEIVERLNPKINQIPFFKYRYKFEENGPQSEDDYHSWLNREPIEATSKIASYNWRALGNRDSQLVNAFKEIILSNKNHIVFTLLDYNKVEALLNSKLTNRTNKFLWSVASMIYYVNFMTIEGFNRPKFTLKLDVPSDTVNQTMVKNKFYNHTNDFRSINDAIIKEDAKFTLIESEKNHYISTFKGGFNEVPDSPRLNNTQVIKVNTSLQFEDNEGEVRKSVIFYTNEKRFKTVVIENQKKVGNKLSIFDEIKVPKGATHYRVIFLLKNFNPQTFKVNYSNVRIG